ncbi:MAG: FHA domain-containing protein [Planctomycetaceae bacterium]|nr:MAG: FHA domain-containing protein [Planctomycetaceae bacterium]
MSTELCLVNIPRVVTPAVIRLPAGRVTVGRSSKQAQVVVAHNSVSRVHAELELIPDRRQVLVFDCNSRNGLFINDEQVSEGCLLVGSWLRLGFPQFRLMELPSNHGDDEGSTEGTNLSPLSPRNLRRRLLTLTGAQKRVVVELLQGKPDAESAADLKLSLNTLRNHIKAIFCQLEVSSRAELLAAFISAEVLADIIRELSQD